MNIREKIGKMPAWKAIIILLFVISVAVVGLEEIVFEPVFYFLSTMITRFENQKKEDLLDMVKDEKNADELDKKMQLDFDEIPKRNEAHLAEVWQNMYCVQYIKIKNAENRYNDLKNSLSSHTNQNDVLQLWQDDQFLQLKNEAKQRNTELQVLKKAEVDGSFDEKKCIASMQ